MSLNDYVSVRDKATQAMFRGDMKTATRLFVEAREMAEGCSGEDPDVIDKAEVNIAMIRVQTHEDDLAEKGLREVLLRSSNDDVTRVAAHCLAKILSHRNEHDKALRFARMALDKSRLSERQLLIASELSLVGNVLANQSYFDEAVKHYEEALEMLEANPLEDAAQHAFYWATITDSVGYALVLLGRLDEGRLRLEQAHERARSFGMTDLVAESASDLCFAYLQLAKLDDAERYGREGLEIAEAQGFNHLRRNFYYLLGEVASRKGDDLGADGWFRRLGEFFPQLPFLGEFLREYDISSMINLKEFA